MTDVVSRVRRGRLSREAIAWVAITIASEVGVSRMSMRAVAKVLNCEAMSLYGYVDSRDDLLLAMAEQLCGVQTVAALRFPQGADALTEDLLRARRHVAIAERLHRHGQRRHQLPGSDDACG